MNVGSKRCDREFNVTDTAQAEILLGAFAMVHAAEFPNAGIGFEQVQVLRNEIVQVDTGGLLFTFDDELDIAGQFALFSEERIDGMQAGGEMSLIVADSTPVHLPVADLGLKGWAVP